jgi:hypothetical protein
LVFLRRQYRIRNLAGTLATILRSIGSRQALDLHWKSTDYLHRLTPMEFTDAVIGAAPMVSDDAGACFLTKGLSDFARRFESFKWEDFALLAHMSRALKDMVPAVAQLSDLTGLDRKQLIRLLDSWRRFRVGFLSSLRGVSLVSWNRVDDLRQIAEAALMLDGEKQSVRLVWRSLAELKRSRRKWAMHGTKAKALATVIDEHDSVLSAVKADGFPDDWCECADLSVVMEKLWAIVRSDRVWAWPP